MRIATPPAAPVTTVHRGMPAAGMTGGLGVPATGPTLLAGEHFAAALLFLIAGAVSLVWIAPDLAAGNYTAPRVAGTTHLFTLGWLTTTIFGALHQLLPVALGATIRSERLGHAGFWAFAPGVALFSSGVMTARTALHHAGIALIATGMALALFNLGRSLRGARTRDVTWAAVAVALTALVATLVLGVVLVHNLHTGFIAAARLRVLGAHLHLALAGFALVLMVGMGQRLFPMFLLAHGVGTRSSAVAVVLLSTGAAVLAGSLTVDSSIGAWIGATALAGGIAAFLVQSRLFFRHRVRRRIDVGMRFAATALGFLAIAAMLGLAVLALGPAYPRLAIAYIVVGLLGGIVMFVIGHFYKIVPFLAWIVHFRGRMGREPLPAVADLYSARVADVQWGLMTLAVIVLASSILAGSVSGTRGGAALFLIGVTLFASQIARVARGPRRT